MPATTQFYVSTKGKDSWSGRYAEPLADGSDGPFASLERARDAMRHSATITSTTVRGGTYFQPEPLELTAADAGVTFQAAAGERVVLSGGTAVSGWTRRADGLWTAKVALDDVDRLTVNGRQQTEARFPDFDPRNPQRGGFLSAEAAAPGEDATRSLRFRQGDFAAGDLKPGMKVTVAGTSGNVLTIASVDYTRRIIRFANDANAEIDTTTRYFVSGAKGELDQPGEWWFDKAAQTLYYQPEAGFDGKGAVVTAASSIVTLDDADTVTLKGFEFADTRLRDGDGQPLQAAVVMTDVSGATVAGNRFINVGGGVVMDDDSHHNAVTGNEFSHIGGNAVDLRPETHENRIVDNLIHDTGETLHAGPAVMMVDSWGNTVAHNRIENVPHAGIGESNNDPAIRSGGNHIAYNELLHTSRETGDTGAIYLFSGADERHEGDVIEYNRIVDTGGLTSRADGSFVDGQDFSWGIYLDDYTSGTTIRGNHVDGSAAGGLYIHGGSGVTATGNLFVNAKENQQILLGEIERPMTGITIANNIIQMPKDGSELIGIDADIAPGAIQANLYHNPAGGPLETAGMSYAAWRAKGGDRGSVVGDPLFTDGAAGDYRLQTGSPAPNTGYKELPWDAMGMTGTPTLPPAAGSAGGPGTTPAPTGPDTIVVRAAADSFIGDPEFKLLVDGMQVGDDTAVSTRKGEGWQDLIFRTDLPDDADRIGVRFFNDYALAGNGDRNLYIDAVTVNGSILPASGTVLKGNGTVYFDIPDQTAPTPAPRPAPRPATGGAARTTITGTTGADVLKGTTANNLINGGRGTDTMTGGAGDDTYAVDSRLDRVIEQAGRGIDTIRSTAASCTLPAHVEHLRLMGSGDIAGTGNGLANIITGNSGGNDLAGGAGDDWISGGAGDDWLTGGTGRDRFLFNSVGEGGDYIEDFKPGADVLDLKAIMTAQGYDGNDPLGDKMLRITLADNNAEVWAGNGQGGYTSLTVLNDVAPSRLRLGTDIIFQ